MKTYLCIDRGSTNADFVVLDSDYRILEKRCLLSRNWDKIDEILQKIIQKFSPDYFIFTGSSSNMPEDFNQKFFIVNEIESIAFGGAYAASKKRCMVVSMGTGVPVVLFNEGRVEHAGGTAVGGGTLTGLSKLLIGETDPLRLNQLAEEGKASEINLMLSEIGYTKVGFLKEDLTVSNFGNLKSNKKNDRAAAIQTMIAEVIGVIASLTSKIYKLEEHIVVTGNLSKSTHIRSTLAKVGVLYKTKFIFPENPEYLTAIGAIRYFRTLKSHPDSVYASTSHD